MDKIVADLVLTENEIDDTITVLKKNKGGNDAYYNERNFSHMIPPITYNRIVSHFSIIIQQGRGQARCSCKQRLRSKLA